MRLFRRGPSLLRCPADLRQWQLLGHAVFIHGLLCAGSRAPASDWPRYLGPDADGMSPESGINRDWSERRPKEHWRTRMSDQGYAVPSVAGGKVFILDHQGGRGVARAIDFDTGEDVWSFSWPDGRKPNYGHDRATPLVAGGRVYGLSRLGGIFCLSSEEGKLLWSRDLVAEFGGRRPEWLYSMSPVLDGRKLILCPGGRGASVVALEKDTGKTIWKGGGSYKCGYATPVVAVIDGRRQYIVLTHRHLIGVDAGDGGVLWELYWRTPYDASAPSPVLVGEDIFITTGWGGGCALVRITETGPKVLWRHTRMQANFNTPAYREGYIYGTGMPDYLICIEARTGRVMWRRRGFGDGGVIGIDGTIIALDGDGGDAVMLSMTHEGYFELGRFRPLGGRSWTPPVIAHGRLMVRNREALVCIEMK